MPSGAIEFYADADDAKAALQSAQAANADLRLELEAVPLGKAFSVTQGLMGLRTPVPTKLIFSAAAVGADFQPEAATIVARALAVSPLSEHRASPDRLR